MRVECSGQIGDRATFILPGRQKPVVGRFYNLEPYHNGTEAQNKLFHSLLMEYFNSGTHSYDAKNFDHFKKQIKRALGKGFEAVAYSYVEAVEVDGTIEYKPRMEVVEKYSDIPEDIRAAEDVGLRTRGILKSWSAYSVKDRRETIDNLIAEMKAAGCNSPKFEEILRGIGS